MRVFVLLAVLVCAYLSESASLVRQFSASHKVWSATWISDPSGSDCNVVKLGRRTHRLTHITNRAFVKSKAAISEIEPLNDGHLHHEHSDGDVITTAYAPTRNGVLAILKERCGNYTIAPTPEPQEGADTIKQIASNGPPENRIDVVLMGDGYTDAEEQKFDADMERLTNDMFEGVTFSAYLPVFNIWTVYRASVQQGIGVGGSPRNTAFGLYRDGTELRGVYCSKPAQARQACAQTGDDACDFPSLIGNDPYYGGLGGEFTISTQSLTSGTIVLRHEMGHNFVDVGEEYDGGSAYFGVNHSPVSSGTNVRWRAWLTEPNNVQLEGSVIRVQDYAWYDLGRGPYTIRFTTDGTYPRWIMRYSVSGCDTPDAIRITLDGSIIPWTTRYTLDRIIYDFFSSTPLEAGEHTLIFLQTSTRPPGNPIRQLCSVTLHEYKPEPQFHMSNSYIGAYPTWRQGRILAGYRPSNEFCLMRNMSSTAFCSVCTEGMWMQFFSVISAIDEVVVTCAGGNQAEIQLNTIKLGQLREGGPLPGEFLQVRWYWGQNYLQEFDDKFSIAVQADEYPGAWEVTVQYVTPQVRADPNSLLFFNLPFQMDSCNTIAE